MTEEENEVPASKDRTHNLVIYGFTVAIFIFMIISSYGSEGFKLDWTHIGLVAAVIALLLHKYFDVIKFGNMLELSKKVKEVEDQTERDSTSFVTEFEELKSEIKNLKSKPETSGGGISIKEKYSKSKSIEEKVDISETVSKKIEKSLEAKEKDCILLLEDPDWRWRTKKKLMRESGLKESEFYDFINKNITSVNAIVKSTIPDRMGNELYRLKRRRK